ncbi:hypothetical protein ACYSNM_07805 [Myroides sp. LJL116]
MSNYSKDPLFVLIKSLSRSEKRQFKLYVNRIQTNSEAKFLSLFNYMDKMPMYCEKSILQQQITTKAQLSNLKANLYRNILVSLRMNPSKKNIRIQIREQLDFATILYQKGLHKQSLKILDKVKALAIDKEEKAMALEIIELEKVIESQYITRSISGRADELIKQSQEISLQNFYSTQLSNLSLKLYSEILTSGYAKNDVEKQKILTLFDDNMLKVDPKVLNFKEKLWYFKTHVWRCFLLQDYYSAYKFVRLWVELFYDHPDMILSNPIWFLKGNSYLFKLILLFKSSDRFTLWNDKLQKVLNQDNFPQSVNIDSIVFLMQFNNKLNHEIIQGSYSGNLLFLKHLQRGINEYSNVIDEHHFLVIYFKVAAVHFGYQNYKESLVYTTKILENTTYSVQQDLLFHTRILSLMAQFESGLDEKYEEYLAANRLLVTKMKNKTPIHDVLMDLFQGLVSNYPDQQKKVLQTYVDTARGLFKNRYYRRSILYIDVLNWANKKLQ